MSAKQFLKSKLFLKQIGLALLFTLVFAWMVMLSLSFYTNRGVAIAVPDFYGTTLEQAVERAEQLQLEAVLKDSMYQKGVKPGMVLRQSIQAGHKVKSGRKIYLTVAATSPEQVAMPKVTDVSLRQARSLLEGKGFAIGQIEYRPSEFNDLVLDAQMGGVPVMAGQLLDNGATIDLMVGRNISDSETLIPDLTGLSLKQAELLLREKSLLTGIVTFETAPFNAEDSAAVRVVKQNPVADSTVIVPNGTPIDLWLAEPVQ